LKHDGRLDSVRKIPVDLVAKGLGLQIGRRGDIGPCPACGAERSGSSDARGPLRYKPAAGWWCVSCGAKGDAIDLAAQAIERCRGRDLSADGMASVLAWYADRGWCSHEADGPDAPQPELPQRPEPGPEVRIPFAELGALWSRVEMPKAGPEVDWLRARGYDVDALRRAQCVGVLPSDYDWPAWWPRRLTSWPVVALLREGNGRPAGLHGRAITADAERKTTTPLSTAAGYSYSGLWMMNEPARLMVLGQAEGPVHQVLVVEGITDFMRAASLAAAVGVQTPILGGISGSFGRLDEVQAPAGCRFYIATDHDPVDRHGRRAGDVYAEQARAVCPGRCWRVLPPDEGQDLDDIARHWSDIAQLMDLAWPLEPPADAEQPPPPSAPPADDSTKTSGGDEAEAWMRGVIESIQTATERTERLGILASAIGQREQLAAVPASVVTQAALALDTLRMKGYGADLKREARQARRDAEAEARRRRFHVVGPYGIDDGDDRSDLNAADKDLRSITAKAWAAIEATNDPPRLFLYAGAPHRIELPDGRLVVAILTKDRMTHELARAARWYRVQQRQEGPAKVATYPPKEVVADVLAEPEPPLPVLKTVVESPVFTPDGRLLSESGFDDASGIYVRLPDDFEMPDVAEHPNQDDIDGALELFHNLVYDFPFDGLPETSHALALFLLPYARELIAGPTPLHLIEKPTPGTGASLLVESLLLPALASRPSAMAESRDDEEWRKRLTAVLGGGERVVFIDNVKLRLDAPSLAIALTAPSWTDRRLQVSELVRYPIRNIWIATGNNPGVSDEIMRRTVRIRLDARQDEPWLRDDEVFRHHDLRAWAAEHRGELCWSACTMLQAWLDRGRPQPDKPRKLGMFEDWSRVIGGTLHACGVPGFLENLVDFYSASDAEGAAIRAFLAAWWENKTSIDGRTTVDAAASDLFAYAEKIDGLPINSSTERGQRIRLGKLLGKLRGQVRRVDDEMSVRVVSVEGRRHQEWRLELC
jgi:hypothetical protein